MKAMLEARPCLLTERARFGLAFLVDGLLMAEQSIAFLVVFLNLFEQPVEGI